MPSFPKKSSAKKRKSGNFSRFIIPLLILVAIPLTVLLVKTQQDIRQKASENPVTLTVSPMATTSGALVTVSWSVGGVTPTPLATPSISQAPVVSMTPTPEFSIGQGSPIPPPEVVPGGLGISCTGSSIHSDALLLRWSAVKQKDIQTVQISNSPLFTGSGTYTNTTYGEDRHHIRFTRVPDNFPGFSYDPTKTYYARVISNEGVSSPPVTISAQCPRSPSNDSSGFPRLEGAVGIPKAYAQETLTGNETIQLYTTGDKPEPKGSSISSLTCQEITTQSIPTGVIQEVQPTPLAQPSQTDEAMAPPPTTPRMAGSCEYRIPANLPAGFYTFRMYGKKDSLIAESAPFIVASATTTTPTFTDKTQAYCTDTTSRIHLEWTPVPQTYFYRITRKTVGGTEPEKTFEASIYAYNDDTVTANTPYVYQVIAVFANKDMVTSEEKTITAVSCP